VRLSRADREINAVTRRSPVPIRLPGKRQHGTTSGYVSGCGCPPCTNAQREYTLARNHRLGVLPRDSAEFEIRQLGLQKHRRAMYQRGCRCDDCKAAENHYQRQYRARRRQERETGAAGRGFGTHVPSQAVGVGPLLRLADPQATRV